eukprot:tig00021352_g20686.t1
MPDLELNKHAADIGKLLLQVQNELKTIRSTIQPGSQPDVSALESIIERAESDLRAKAEAVLQTVVDDNVTTLPMIRESTPKSQSLRREASPSEQDYGPQAGPSTARGPRPLLRRPRPRDEVALREMLRNPTGENARAFLLERFGVPAARETGGVRAVGRVRLDRKRLATGKLSSAGGLPAVGRKDPTAPPPPVPEEELGKGLLHLVNRGYLHPSADLTLAFTRAPAIMSAAPATYHEWYEQFERGEVLLSPGAFNFNAVRLDLADAKGAAKRRPPPERKQATLATATVDAPGGIAPNPPPAPREEERAEARGYDALMDQYSLHEFIIRKGRTLDSTPEFVSYRRTYAHAWGPIAAAIGRLERIMAEHHVFAAYVDGKALAELATDDLRAPTVAELVACVKNADQLPQLSKLPGRRFKGNNGKERAAAAMQATWRMFVTRREYEEGQRRQRAARRIQLGWRLYAAARRTREAIAATRALEAATFKQLAADFHRAWPTIKTKPRVVIHLPSLTRDESQRMSTTNFAVRQNSQMSRLCDAGDPLVEVVYVAPFQLASDVQQYYEKLLAVGGVRDAPARIKVVYPENHHRFPAHFSTTTLLLYSPRALKRLANFIRGKTAYIVPGHVGPDEVRLAAKLGVPVLGPDPAVAGIYGTKSGAKRIFAAAHVNTAPGAHDLYEERDLVARLAELMVLHPAVPRWLVKIDDEFGGRGHAVLDVAHVKGHEAVREEYRRMPEAYEHPGRREAAVRRLAEELPRALARRAAMAVPELYPSWAHFAETLARVGGVVEAAPPVVVGSPSANLLVEPDGTVSLLSTHQQLFLPGGPGPFCFGGALFPQQSVPHAAVREAALAIGRECHGKGLVGYMGVDFLALREAEGAGLVMWAVDLNLRLTDTQAAFALFHFVTAGRYSPADGSYRLPPAAPLLPPIPLPPASAPSGPPSASSSARSLAPSPPPGPEGPEAGPSGSPPGSAPQASSSRNARGSLALQAPEGEERCYVSLDYVAHPNLATMQYGVFFNLCRLKGVCFDLHARAGTCFSLLDSFAGGALGLLCSGPRPGDAARAAHEALDFIQQQVGFLRSDPTHRDPLNPDSNFNEVFGMVKGLCDRLKVSTRKASKHPPPRPSAAVAR